MFCVIHCFRLIRLVTLWLLICCRGGYWFSNKMFPPNKCFHYISIIDGAWVERWGIVTNETNTNSTNSFMFSLFSSLNMFVAQFPREMLPVVRSTTVVIQRCFQFLSVSQAFPSHKANNDIWAGHCWAPGHHKCWQFRPFPALLSRVPAPGYSQYPGPGTQVRGLSFLLGHNNWTNTGWACPGWLFAGYEIWERRWVIVKPS